MIGGRRHHGFTLIELLITAAIFSVAALLATTVFSNIQRTQRRIQNQQRVTADGRYVVETIARSIRTGNINYAQFTASKGVVTNPTSTISTTDQDGKVTCYRLNNQKVEVATAAASDCTGGTTIWTAFTPDDLQVDTLSFFINPVSDPFRPVPRANADCAVPPLNGFDLSTGQAFIAAGFDPAIGACICQYPTDCFGGQVCTDSGTKKTCANPTVQPHVTIYIRTKSKNAAVGEVSSSTMQTTVASRLYQ